MTYVHQDIKGGLQLWICPNTILGGFRVDAAFFLWKPYSKECALLLSVGMCMSLKASSGPTF